MATQHYQKPPNGQARSSSYLLVFDLDDDGQAKAWEVAQQLASQRKLKHVLVGMLLAIHTVQEQTGKALDLLQFMASFITGIIHGDRGGYSGMQIIDPEELPTMFARTDNHADPPKNVRTSVRAWVVFCGCLKICSKRIYTRKI
jgi:hypothetical protein